MDTFLPIMHTSFILSMRTGNIIFDTIIAALMVALMKNMIDNKFDVWSNLKNIFRNKSNIKSEYLIQGKVYSSSSYCTHYTYFPEEYKSIMYQLSKKYIDIKFAKQFNVSREFGKTLDNTTNNFSYSINTSKEIKMNSDILIRQDNSTEKSDGNKNSTEIYDLYIYSYTKSFIELKEMITEWSLEYKQYIKEYNDGNYYHFSYLGNIREKDKGDKQNEVYFESNVFHSNKTFDNLFFEQKEDLFNRLQYFMTNENRYKLLGIPHSLGLMFYGFPGCGKTSCAKAIANHTQRHIVEISLSKIKTCGELRKVFLNENINGYYVPSNKKIIILEDIDCMNDIVKKRDDDGDYKETIEFEDGNKENNEEKEKEKDSDKNTNKDTNNLDANLFIKAEIKKMELYDTMMKNKDIEDKITLSYLLNLIDGILEQPGRILIITTNKPNSLDQALIRPGRIDMKIEFKKCNSQIINQILQLYFNKGSNIKFQDYVHTQADVFEKCFNINDYEKVVKFLLKTTGT